MSDTKYTPRESFWRGHWAAIDGTAQPTPNDDEAAYQRGAEHGARALAEAMRCKTYRERWAWIGCYFAHLAEFYCESVAYMGSGSEGMASDVGNAAWEEPDQ